MNDWESHQGPTLDREDMGDDPITTFADWFKLALESRPMPERMTLATVDSGGWPDARIVLLKGFGPGGFRFFTNYESGKSEQLAACPRAALVFHWPEIDRQVRVRGKVERLAGEESDRYFATRDRLSQLGAWASPQSRPLTTRQELEGRLADTIAQFGGVESGREVTRPEHWGGYRVVPMTIEFWQGRPGRLHDRFRFTRQDQGWAVARLAP